MTEEKLKFKDMPLAVKFVTYWLFLKVIVWGILCLAYMILVAVDEKPLIALIGAIVK